MSGYVTASPFPDASTTVRGVVNTTTQTFAGLKIFQDGLATSFATGLAVSGGGNTANVYSAANGLTINVNGSAVFAWGTAAFIPLGSQAIGTASLRFNNMWTSGTFNTNVASGSDAFKSIDGARWNFSTADASAYLYRSAANTISTTGAFGCQSISIAGVGASATAVSGYFQAGSATTSFYASSAGAFISQGTFGAESRVADGGSAIAFLFNNSISLANATAKLASFQNNSVEKAYVDSSGSVVGGNILASAGRIYSRNASGGFSFGTVGIAYLDMPSGTANINFASAVVAFDASSTLNFNRGSGSDFLKALDGSRLNLSTADASAYFSRTAADTIVTPANFQVGSLGPTAGFTNVQGGLQLSLNKAIYFNGATQTKYIAWDGTSIYLGGRVQCEEALSFFSYTDDSATAGNRTVNKVRGKNSVAIGAATCVVTNSFVTANSQILVTLEFVDATATSVKACIPAAGSFTLTVNANATAATKFSWTVIN